MIRNPAAVSDKEKNQFDFLKILNIILHDKTKKFTLLFY